MKMKMKMSVPVLTISIMRSWCSFYPSPTMPEIAKAK